MSKKKHPRLRPKVARQKPPILRARRAMKSSDLLPKDALVGVRLGISVSESPDLLRLGLIETHFRLALAEIARSVIVSGGQLAYGGHLAPEGYTAFLLHELERYNRRDRPLRLCLAWSEHRKLRPSDIERVRQRLGLYGEIMCLDIDGKVLGRDAEGDESPKDTMDPTEVQRGLAGLRRYMADITQGRVLIGGKRRDFQGDMPGLLEEALYSVERGNPLYLAGGFGGVTWDVAKKLGIDDGNWFPSPEDTDGPNEKFASGMAKLAQVAATTKLQSLQNGLSAAENRLLAASHRPSEIASLVSLGLGRKFSHPKDGALS